MNDFIARYQEQLSGTLSGFDRLVFLGTLWRNRLSGLKGYRGRIRWAPETSLSMPSEYPSG